MKKSVIAIISIFVLFQLTPFIFANPECGASITESTTLDGNMTCPETGISITSDNVVLDCDGHTIFYAANGDSTSDKGVNAVGRSNVTIKNCRIVDGNLSGTNGEGIYFPSPTSEKITIYNNFIDSDSKEGAYFSTKYSNFTKNEIHGTSYGARIYSQNSFFKDNKFIGTTGGALTQTIVNNTFENNTFLGTNAYGIYFYYGSSNNTFIKNNITGPNTALYLRNNNHANGIRNNLFRDCIQIEGNTYSVRYFDEENKITNNTFLNCSYDLSKELVQGTGNYLVKKWYYRIYANYTSGNPISNAIVTARNSTGELEFNITTNSSGYTGLIPITDYVNREGKRSYYSNYTINVSDGLVYGSHEMNITATQNFLNDYITLESDSENPKLEINAPANNSNFTTTINFNFTVTDNEASTMNCIFYLDGIANESNSSTANDTLTNIQVTGISEGNHTGYISCSDLASNTNISATSYFNIDLSGPTANSIQFTPNSIENLDPEKNMSFNINITDSITYVQTAILQLYNHSDSSWENYSLSNIGNRVYQTNMTLPSTETNYTFNIFSEDILGNTNISSNTTFEATWDCSWTATPDLGANAGYNENKFLGNITINNTGDQKYSNGNCSLDFSLSYNLDYISDNGRIYYNGENFKNLQLWDGEDLTAGNTKNISINATFLSEIREESLIITITEFRSRSNTSELNTTGTLVTNQNGPYIYNAITNAPSSVYLTNSNFSLQGYVRNLMGSTTENETLTAYNVTLSWILPSGITNTSGNLTREIENISDNSLYYNNLEANFNNLASMTPGEKIISLTTRGYNQTGSLIENSNGQTMTNQTQTINFLCYNSSDRTCVEACGHTQDPDCEQETTITNPRTTGPGGGGSGGGGGTAQTLTTAADYQLIRGQQNKITIPFENKNAERILNRVSFSVKGDIAKYIKIAPNYLEKINPREKINLELKITSPTYIELGRQELIIEIRGYLGSTTYAENKKITLEIHDLTKEEASELLKESEKLIKKFEESGFNYSRFNELYNESLNAMKIEGYETVRDNYEILKENIEKAIESKELIKDLETAIEKADEKEIDTSSSTRLLKLAKLSLERNNFIEAYNRVKEAQIAYVLETKGKIGKLTYYLKENPEEIGIGLFLALLLSFSAYKTTRLQNIKRKIRYLKEEERIIGELIKAIQKECFEERKMSMDEYEQAMKQYQERISHTIQELIRLENERAHLMKFVSKNKKLQNERNKIITMIKNLQEDYLKNGRVETKRYYLTLESYNKRLTEIDEKLSLLEAKKAFKKGKIK